MDIVDPVISAEEEDYEDGENEEIPKVMLKESVSLQEALDNSILFEVNMNYAEKDDHQLSYFNKEELLRCSHFECLYEDDDTGEKIQPGKTPFEKMASQMTSVTEDGKLKKKEMKPGYGTVVPEGAFVTIHYNSYVEYGDEPYDSTWLRGRPIRFRLNRNCVIPGFDLAIATMKKAEHSRFLIHPDLGYGKFGCPPRIPANAELLFDIELVNFEDNAAADAFEALSLDERKKQDFSVILKAARAQHLIGNDLFKKDQIKPAIKKFIKAVNILEKCSLKDEAEEKQQQNELLKLYVNLGVCYNKLKASGLACTACKDALAIDPKNAKALFNWGRALLVLSDYKEAKRHLLEAQKLEPNNISITEELKKLEKKQKSYNTEVKSFSQRAFKTHVSPPKQTTVKKAEVTEKFQNEVVAIMKDFITNSEKEQMNLPSHLTAQEELCIRQKAQENGLIVRSHEQKGEIQLFLLKPEHMNP